MATLKLCIDGMAGHEDEARIERALREEPGVLGVVANHEAACAEIEYEDDEVSLARILSLVRALGYATEVGG